MVIISQQNEIIFKLGRNARENFELIDEGVDINDNYWWFHLNEHPSGHCIVHSEKLEKDDIIYASNLVKSYSKLKEEKRVLIIYTQLKNIRKSKTLGEVIILNNPKIITI
jgi:predicted ribosome quality control (RQC) complex YloA/Tae2 family protein